MYFPGPVGAHRLQAYGRRGRDEPRAESMHLVESQLVFIGKNEGL